MNFLRLIFLAVFLIVFVCIPLANSDILTARQLPSTKIDVQATPEAASGTTTQPSEKIAYGESSTHISINAMPTSEYPLSITKRIIERSDDGYFVDVPIRILVQVTCMAGKNVDEIGIWEHTDKNLAIINCKKFFRSSIVNQTINPEKYLYENYSYDKENNLIYIPLKGIYSKESVVYEYSLKPTKAGIYNSYTLIRIPSDYPIYPDYELPLEIKAVEEHPEFQVFLDINELEWNIQDTVPLRFIIKYLGGASHNPCTYNITLIKSNKSELSETKFSNMQFSVHNNTIINSSIKYSEEGIYGLPTININGQYYKFDEQIKIKKSWRDYIADSGLFLVTFLLFFATFGHVLATAIEKDKEIEFWGIKPKKVEFLLYYIIISIIAGFLIIVILHFWN